MKCPNHPIGSVFNQKGQTALEYMMIVLAVIIPLAAAINRGASADEEANRKALVTRISEPAFGTENRMGVIGRPYP